MYKIVIYFNNADRTITISDIDTNKMEELNDGLCKSCSENIILAWNNDNKDVDKKIYINTRHVLYWKWEKQ